MAVAYDAGLIDRIMPKLKQYEANTGRRVTPQMLEALLKSELEVEAGRAERNRALSLQEKELGLRERALDAEKEAAKIGGVADIAGTYATYKLAQGYLGKGAPATALAATSGAPAVADIASATGKFAAPTFGESAFSAGAGAQAALTGTTAAPAQFALTAPGATAPAIAGPTTFELPAFAAEGAASTAGGGVAFGGPLAGAGIAKVGASMLGANQEISNTAAGAVGGWMLGSQIGSVGGPAGAILGGVIGLGLGEVADSVLCTYLHQTGQLDTDVFQYAGFYSAEQIPESTYMGYRVLADPLVRRAKKSRFWNQVVRWIGIPMSKELAHRFRPKKFPPSRFGKVVLGVGIPLCNAAHRLVPDKKLVSMEVL